MTQEDINFVVRHAANRIKRAIETVASRDPGLGSELQSIAQGIVEITDALQTEVVALNHRIADLEQAAQKSNPKDGPDL